MKQRLITLRGVVIPIDWDDAGNVIATALATYDEQEYLIDQKRKGKEFFSILQEPVEIHGVCRIEGEKKVIVVNNYQLIEKDRTADE